MPRHIFYSFEYDGDCHRSQMVRNIGVVTGEKVAHGNDWETVRLQTDAAIERWIENQLNGTSCTVVLVGSDTANSRWVKHEIKRAWALRKGLLGIRIHALKDMRGMQTRPGPNPFLAVWPSGGQYVPFHEPWSSDSSTVYREIESNLEQWIEAAIRYREGQQ